MFKILCNFLFIFFILFFEAYSYENSDIKPYSLHQIFLTCSANKTTFIKNNKEKVSIIISDNLDLNCFKRLNKKLSKSNEIKINKTYINEIKFTTNNSIQEKFQYQILEFLNPTYLSCGEKCNFSKHQIIRILDDYYYLDYSTDFGIEGSLINKNLILFKAKMSTHVRNIIYHLNAEKVFNLPDGNLKFYDDFIEVFNKKSYFKGGGAFWYDYRINYNGKLIELLEYNKRCISIDKFYEDSVIKKYLTKYGKKKFCLEK